MYLLAQNTHTHTHTHAFTGARRGPRVILIRADLERETLGKHACDRAVFVETNRIYQQIHKNTS